MIALLGRVTSSRGTLRLARAFAAAAGAANYMGEAPMPRLRPKGEAFQPGRLRLIGHEVRILHGLAGGAFAKIVDRAHRDDEVSLRIARV